MRGFKSWGFPLIISILVLGLAVPAFSDENCHDAGTPGAGGKLMNQLAGAKIVGDLPSSPLILKSSDASVSIEASVGVYSPSPASSKPHFHLVASVSKAQKECLEQQRDQLLAALSSLKGKPVKDLAGINLRNIVFNLRDDSLAQEPKMDPDAFIDVADAKSRLEISLQLDQKSASEPCRVASSSLIRAKIQEMSGKGPLGSHNPELQRSLVPAVKAFPVASWER